MIIRYPLPAIRYTLYALRYPLPAIRYTLLIVLLIFLPAIVFSQGPGNLTAPGNKHNLSSTQTGTTIRAVSETRICIFCHTPHSAIEVPLWNHTLSSAQYTVSVPPGVTGTQLTYPLNPPDGDSKLCLSCHDGTVPLGAVHNLGGVYDAIIQMGAGIGLGPLTGPSVIGTDLSGHHLVSIEYNSSLAIDKAGQCPSVTWKLKNPPPGPPYLQRTRSQYVPGCSTPGGCRDQNNWHYGVQCTSCHDPHYDPTPGQTKFLRNVAPSQGNWPWNNYSGLCCTCHVRCDTGACP